MRILFYVFCKVALLPLIIFCTPTSTVTALPNFTIEKLSNMGGAANSASVSDDGCITVFSEGYRVMLFDCKVGSSVQIADGFEPVVSANGRFVAFTTSVQYVSIDTNSNEDIYLFDRQTSDISLVSIGYNGAPGNGYSFFPAISATGRYVAFESGSDNIVAVDNNHSNDIFVRDLEQPVIVNTLVSVAEDGSQGTFLSRGPSISADGSRVAFYSLAADLVANDSNDDYDVFVRDWKNLHTYRASMNAANVGADQTSGIPVISGDGRYVAFASMATNLTENDTNGSQDIFLKDLETGAVELISQNVYNVSGNSFSGCDYAHYPARCLGISASGRFIAFPSAASDLVSNDTQGYTDVFLLDRQQDILSRISYDWAGDPGNDDSGAVDISSDGRFVAFESEASLVGNHFEDDLDVFLMDRGEETSAGDPLPFIDDFSDAQEGARDPSWAVKSGSWKVRSEELVSALGKSNLALIKQLNKKPYPFSKGIIDLDLSIKANKTNIPNLSIIFAYRGSAQYRFVKILPGQLQIGQLGTLGNQNAVLFAKSVGLKANKTYSLRIVIKATGRIEVYNGSKRIGAFKFKKPVTGAVGLQSDLAKAVVDNVHITE